MYQTMVPFVQLFIRNIDVINSPDGKPRTLVAFSFTEAAGSSVGKFSIELFDPEYVAIEELMLTTGVSGIDVAEGVYNATNEDSSDQNAMIPIHLRFGYRSENKTVAKPEGSTFFVGYVSAYTTQMVTNGVHLTIEGLSIGSAPNKHLKRRVLPKTYNLSLHDTIQKVCDLMEWDLKSINNRGSELPEDQKPEDLWGCAQGFETTEEQHKSFKMGDNETALQFIERIVNDARPNDKKYGPYTFELVYTSTAKEGKVKGTLYYGPIDFDKYPVRRYVYMRDPMSDVISFTPTIIGIPFAIAGGTGFVHKSDNLETGEVVTKVKNEPNRYLSAYPRSRRLGGITTLTRAEVGALPEGYIESNSPEYTENIEGTNTGANTAAPHKAYHLDDEVTLEISNRETNKLAGDRQAMNYFLLTQMMANSATIEVFGDPSPDLAILNLVTVLILVPTGPSERLEPHYLSNIYLITGIHHQISGGSYTTTLTLVRNGFADAGSASKAIFVEIESYFGEDSAAGIG